jgi:hypothetical protein
MMRSFYDDGERFLYSENKFLIRRLIIDVNSVIIFEYNLK